MKHLDMVKLLVESGADINAKATFGQTPLDYASGDIEKYLIDSSIAQKEREQEEAVPEKVISNKDACIICLAPKNDFYILLPCAHASLCKSCCVEIIKPENSKCPTCRKPIERFSKIFFQSS